MISFPGSPRLLKGGIVLIDPNNSQVQRIIVMQYNPDTLSRTLQVQGVGGESGDRQEALRLKGPPVETIKLDAEIDATDQLEFPKQNSSTAELGIFPQLAALETIIYPSSGQLQNNNSQAIMGTLEIAPMETFLSLFVWSQNRILPVRLTEFSITEEAFDTSLNPIRAKVSLGMQVLNINDLGFNHKGGNLFMVYQRQKEQFVRRNRPGIFSSLGITGIP
ncbi:MAG: hypothetical protein HC836_14135 [Richelia sp. RM2_1_2]|nr:hypothetical protein [Candidatus Methylacidiphilales bacterium]NJN06632.1 hypothetical protein [Richelia sp. RM1_1_1]NJO27186.1 hypothetical protein [Richelia sp. SL_2_1]NJO59397.1 hypothetical protein [Richelia sp. RM2_1_2]